MLLVLASTSPRRRELLALLQVPFDAVSPLFQEIVRLGVGASDQCREFARGKARAVALSHPDAIVLGCDTLIELEGEVVGKPGSPEEARDMLGALRGRSHHVWTAISVVHAAAKFEETAISKVDVQMRRWAPWELEAYLATGESLDKAGGYAIQGQGGQLIERIDGDYTAVVGLPLRTAATLLARAGCAVSVDIDDLYRRRPYANWPVFVSEFDQKV